MVRRANSSGALVERLIVGLALLGCPQMGFAAGVVKIERISPPSLDLEVSLPGTSTSPAISADGHFVAFVVEDGNIYVRDRQSGKTDLVSVSTSGAQANGYSGSPAISADGRFVAFVSYASNLVPGATMGAPSGGSDVFVRDRQAGKTELVSVGTRGEPANDASHSPSISGDGRFVAFRSGADNLVQRDTNKTYDIFVRDRQTGKTELVSVSTSGAPAGGGSPSISADGRSVAFVSAADNLVPGDTNGKFDVFVAERQ